MIRELRKVLKQMHYPRDLLLFFARWFTAYSLKFRDLEWMKQERGVFVDNSVVHPLALKILPIMALIFRRSKLHVSASGPIDEVNTKVAGQWKFHCRPVDKSRVILLTARRHLEAVLRSLKCGLGLNGPPEKIIIDTSESDNAAIPSINYDACLNIELRRSTYINNMIEQDRRAVKHITALSLGFISFWSASKLISRMENLHLLKQVQLHFLTGRSVATANKSIAWQAESQATIYAIPLTKPYFGRAGKKLGELA